MGRYPRAYPTLTQAKTFMLPLLKFDPYFKSVIWGGRRIAEFKGIPSQGDKIGESWEISPMPGHESVVAEGSFKGLTLNQITKDHAEDLLGKKVNERYEGRFPLLVKYIDSRDDLSIQVHPDDRLAMLKHGSEASGKTEMWYSLLPEEGAFLYSGFIRPTTPGEVRAKIADNTIMDLLAKFYVKPGDVFFLPAGRVHAIGAGNLLVEIQQASDITYRMYDYDRRDTDGNPRELHIEDAIQAIHYDDCPQQASSAFPTNGEFTRIADSEYFSCHLRNHEGEASFDLRNRESFTIVMCLRGNLTVTTVDPSYGSEAHTPPLFEHSTAHLRQGETLLIPAVIPAVTFGGSADLLVVHL